MDIQVKNGVINPSCIIKVDSTSNKGGSEMNYIVSTIQLCATVNKPLLRNMLAFADAHNVPKIYLFVMAGKNKDETAIASILQEDPRIEFLFLDKTGMKLNSNLKLFDTQILASQINPLTGFNKKLHRDFSYILPACKRRRNPVPNTSKHPRFLATTGALTNPNYKLHTAQGRKAELEHQFGFAYVEVKNTRLFDLFSIEAKKNGNFHFMREFYKGGKVYDTQPEALVLGDWHTGDTCPKVRAITLEMLDNLKPKRAVFHDLFNGHSINHHERSDVLSKTMLFDKKIHVLDEEIKQCLDELNYFADRFKDVKFLISESNHDLFLRTYIGNPEFLRDGQNAVFACKLFVEMAKGHEQPILKTAMELIGKPSKNTQFLNEDEEYRVQGVGLDVHGHRGANGARGSAQSFSNNNLKLITAHGHSIWIHPNGVSVGTSTHKKLGYTKGQSSWEHGHCLLYPDGTCLIIPIII